MTARDLQVQAAAEARTAGDYAQARRILSGLLDPMPDDPDLLRRLAMVEAGDGNLAEALSLVDRASQLAPDDLDVALARGYILYWLGEFDAAESAADLIAEHAPDYPELAVLQANLDRSRDGGGFRLRALSVSGGLSDIAFENRASQTWTSQAATIAVDLSARSSVTIGLAREERQATDTRLSARFDQRFGNGFAYIAASVVPKADFRERWSAAVGGEVRVAERLTAILDTRVAEYNTGAILAVQPGLRLDMGHDFAVTGKAINIFGGGESYRLGGSLRFDYRPVTGPSLFAIAASYPDVEADGVRRLQSGAVGLAVPLSDRVSLSAATSYEDRKDSYRRLSGSLALAYRFGAQ